MLLTRCSVLLAISCLPVCLLFSVAQAWDGHWTQAESGETLLYDPNSTEGMSNTTDRPQRFWIPPTRLYKDVDPKEIEENRRRDYSPYALARFPFNMQFRGQPLSKGYYQVKAGDETDGSPATQMAMANHQKLQPINNTSSSAGQSSATKSAEHYSTFVLKRLGKVIAVIPIEGSEPYKRKKGEKWPKDALAWIDTEDFQPVLKFYYKKRVYHTRLEASY